MTTVPETIAQAFAADQPVTQISPLGNGLINDTFLVITNQRAFVLQRINRQVFQQPEHIIDNLRQLHQHLADKPTASLRLRLPKLLSTADQQYFLSDASQQVWRALELIPHSDSREQISRDREAEQVGAALGHFHALFSELDQHKLHDTLPGFHITPTYYQSYCQQLTQQLTVADDEPYRFCRAFIDRYQVRVDSLERARQRGILNDRVIHGDPKLNNFLFHRNSDDIISLIDLDTVKPGLIHYDIGDCLRSCCHIEQGNRFDSRRAGIILRHYLNASSEFISHSDCDYLYDAIWLIPFELGLRFFTDYLQGNRYFKTHAQRDNLHRAIAQFELCADIERQQPDLTVMLDQLRREIFYSSH